MTKEKTTEPDFILCDMGIQSAFSKMCQTFKEENSAPSQPPQDWLIIDNETGEIISPLNQKKE